MPQSISITLSIGCNNSCDTQMQRIRERLQRSFPDIVFTDSITTPAYGMPEDTPPYSNALAKATTLLTEKQLNELLKEMEREMGDTREQRNKGVVMMDLDLLEYDGDRRHEGDWARPYVIQLLPRLLTICLMLLCLMTTLHANSLMTAMADNRTATAQPKEKVMEADKKKDTELLGKAVDYYVGGKYHESILAFEKLQKRYKLSPRFKAYLGMSYYKVSKYPEAIEELKQGIPQLTALAPKEQAVYIYSCAESLFRMERYEEAIPYYKMALPMTEGNDRGDVLFHTAFAHHLLKNDSVAVPLFKEAHAIYSTHTQQDELHRARKRQIEIMMRGFEGVVSDTEESTPVSTKEKQEP